MLLERLGVTWIEPLALFECAQRQLQVGHVRIAGLAAAYALPPSALPPSIPPRTPNHDYTGSYSQSYSQNYDFNPPRTPGDSTQLGLEPGHQFLAGAHGIGPSNGQLYTSSQFGAHKLSSSSYNYSGGQYAKYGKRY